MSQSPVKHPLADLFPAHFRSFDEWLVKWSATSVVSEKLGLLHCLQMMEYWLEKPEQAVFFLLEVADGHANGNPFHFSGFGDERTVNDARRAIARKAFDVLCVKLFASGKEGYPPLWWWMLEKQETFEKLLWFCRPGGKNYERRLTNEKVSHQEEIYASFLQEFARLGWTHRDLFLRYRASDTMDVGEVSKRIVEARPQFIEILRYSRQLNWLNCSMSDYGNDFPELDRACLKKLKEIAFEGTLLLPAQDCNETFRNRKPNNLHEAVRGGSVAAQILVLHSIRQKIDKECAARYRDSVLKRDAAERIRELARIQADRDALEQQVRALSGQ